MKLLLLVPLIVLALMLGGPIRERWQDSNDFHRQEQQLQLEQQTTALRDWQAQQQATAASRALLGNFAYLGVGLAGIICLMIVGDFYRQRRAPLAKFGGELVARDLIASADPVLIAALAERMRLNGIAAIEAARNVGSPVTYSPHFGRAGELQQGSQDVAGELVTVAPPALTVAPATPTALLADWRDRKLIAQSTSSLLLGFDKSIGSIEPSSGVYLTMGEESDVALIAVSGDSGSGKTSTMRFLLAQCAMNGAALVLCDPHGRKNSQSLIQSCGPLADSFLMPPAISWSEIADAVTMVDRIGRARLNDAEDTTPIVLVLDEFNDTARNMPDFKVVANLLNNIGRSYRKVGIFCILCIHNWRVAEWRSGTLKDSVQAVIFHRLAKAESKLFVSDPTIAQQISYLPQGDALYFKRGQPKPTRLTGIPFVTRDTLDQARSLYIPAPQTLASMHTDTDAGADTDADTLLERLIVGTDTHTDGLTDSAPRAGASAHNADAGAPADADTPTDADAHTPAAEQTRADVQPYLQAYVLAGMTRQQARDTLARIGVAFDNAEWTIARSSVGLN